MALYKCVIIIIVIVITYFGVFEIDVDEADELESVGTVFLLQALYFLWSRVTVLFPASSFLVGVWSILFFSLLL